MSSNDDNNNGGSFLHPPSDGGDNEDIEIKFVPEKYAVLAELVLNYLQFHESDDTGSDRVKEVAFDTALALRMALLHELGFVPTFKMIPGDMSDEDLMSVMDPGAWTDPRKGGLPWEGLFNGQEKTEPEDDQDDQDDQDDTDSDPDPSGREDQ